MLFVETLDHFGEDAGEAVRWRSLVNIHMKRGHVGCHCVMCFKISATYSAVSKTRTGLGLGLDWGFF